MVAQRYEVARVLIEADTRGFQTALNQCRWAIFRVNLALRRAEHDTRIAAASGWGEDTR